MNIDWTAVFAALVPQLFTLLGLTLAQVILGIAVALKTKIFEWQKLGDFFLSIIIPRVLAWLSCMIVVLLVPKEYLSSELTSIIQSGTFLIVVASFTGSIIANLRALGFLSDNTTLDKVGLPVAVNEIRVIGVVKPLEKA